MGANVPETLRFPLCLSCCNARRCAESRTQSRFLRALYCTGGRTAKIVLWLKRDAKFNFLRSRRKVDISSLSKSENVQKTTRFQRLWELLERRSGRFRVSRSDLTRKPRCGCGSSQERNSSFFKRTLFSLKPENHPSVEQVLAATKGDAALANVPKTICFPLCLSSRRATLSGELRRRVSFQRWGEGRKATFWARSTAGRRAKIVLWLEREAKFRFLQCPCTLSKIDKQMPYRFSLRNR